MSSSKKIRLRELILAGTLGAWLTGCAMLGFGPSTDDENLDMTDPVVRAALSVRSGSSDLRTYDRSPASSAESAVQIGRLNREIVPGMDMRDVRSVLGEPLEVETAGGETDGNQRWIYSDGYRGQLNHGPSRILYFEDGKVAGWRNYDSH